MSQFGDFNNLIYSIGNHLPDVENVVLSLVILYLSAGLDLTEKWYSKTHATFLKRYTTHSSSIGDLVFISDQGWFSRKRRNNSNQKEKIHPSKSLRV